MTTVELRFPARRYHGTVWGRHVNEGVPEWPPSPYRFLRALYDTWRRKCAHIPEERVRSLFSALGSALPIFHIPRVVASHTRSYLSSNTEDPSDKSLIFDAFVALAPGASCYMQWPIELTFEERAALSELLAALNYLGRSESWIDAGVGGDIPGDLFLCVPGTHELSGELIQIACPVPPSEYSGKRSWFEALTYSTSEMLKERRSGPPAMRNISYLRASGAVETWLSPKARQKAQTIAAVKLALSSRVLPLATDSVVIAERVRAALMRLVGPGTPALLHGKDEKGKPLQGHQHLFVLPQANSLGHIHEVLLISPVEPFHERELDAIRQLRILHRSEGPHKLDDHPIRVVVAQAGARDDPAFRKTRTEVESKTPFVAPRHWRKGRGLIQDFLIEEVRRECRNHGLPEPAAIELLKDMPGHFQAIRFRRNRQKDEPKPGFAFCIHFPEPVLVPFSLGYGCHFGLGQFG